ncbi:MAG TPA: hypothetical protein ENK83_08170 [Aliiroseovarius sp.]|nr:hypothetical protein [Aliiroseovarius sp.]
MVTGIEMLRGPLLIGAALGVFGAIWLVGPGQAPQDQAASELTTRNAARENCEARGIDTAIGRIGCLSEETTSGPVRTTRAGGAAFITPAKR